MSLVDKRTAQKLKILGYNSQCDYVAHDHTPLADHQPFSCNSNLPADVCVMPTWNDIFDWLYDTHKILCTGDLSINEEETKMWFVAVITKVSMDNGKVTWNQRTLPSEHNNPQSARNDAIREAVFQLNP